MNIFQRLMCAIAQFVILYRDMKLATATRGEIE
jgi:hypothetical protein